MLPQFMASLIRASRNSTIYSGYNHLIIKHSKRNNCSIIFLYTATKHREQITIRCWEGKFTSGQVTHAQVKNTNLTTCNTSFTWFIGHGVAECSKFLNYFLRQSRVRLMKLLPEQEAKPSSVRTGVGVSTLNLFVSAIWLVC